MVEVGKKYIKPIEINQSVAEPRDVQLYRKILAKSATLAQDACNSLAEHNEIFARKVFFLLVRGISNIP